MEKITVGQYTTGYRRGYIRIADRCEVSVNIADLKTRHKRSNAYRAAKYLSSLGATVITVCHGQHPRSTQYCYSIYTGYRAA